MIIGLTGPVGSGKTQVARMLSRCGYQIIDADRLGHELLAPQSEPWSRVVRAFGVKILNRGGVVNRRKLSDIVFADRKKLKQLNEIMQPYLRKKIEESCKQLAASSKLIVIDAALPELFKGLADKTWVIIAPQEQRIKRLLKQGKEKKQIRQILGSQRSQKEYLKLADVTIENYGTLKKLNAKVQANLQL